MKPLICFDWDGTMVNSMALCVAEVRLAMKRLGLPEPSVEDCKWCNGPSYEETVTHLNIPPELARTYIDERMKANVELCNDYNELYPGIREMLEALQGKAELCIVSNGHRGYIEHCMRTFRVGQYFTRIEAAQIGRTKTQALQEILDAYPGVPAIMVGDRFGDLQAGRNCGIPTLAACYGFGNETEWAGADLRADSAEEMTVLLKAFIEKGGV